MKTLLILRHAKAENDAPKGDAKRALTKRGEREAADIARQIEAITGVPNAIVSSDAKRARQTAKIAAEYLDYSGKVVTKNSIYAAGVDALMRVVRKLPGSAGCVLLVGHNPGFEELVETLAPDGSEPVTLPTAGLAHMQFDTEDWKSIKPGTGRLLGVYGPQGAEADSNNINVPDEWPLYEQTSAMPTVNIHTGELF